MVSITHLACEGSLQLCVCYIQLILVLQVLARQGQEALQRLLCLLFDGPISQQCNLLMGQCGKHITTLCIAPLPPQPLCLVDLVSQLLAGIAKQLTQWLTLWTVPCECVRVHVRVRVRVEWLPTGLVCSTAHVYVHAHVVMHM